MNRTPFLGAVALVLGLAAGLAAGAAMPAWAQNEIVAAPNPDADRLAEEVRVLAADPRNMDALLAAGELSARLGDTSAALAFFQRAEALDADNPRIAAGRAMALVRLERPGEALRLFESAEARGLTLSRYASDRGFAYDLLGASELAQREYKVALAADRDDETVRRYALSLGITGHVDEAMRELDPLLRRSDRAAWRARAFILAMNGDVAGAERIAESMMPGNMGAGLTPFFHRLAGLSPADRAFAVHFGELSPSQARLADARLAPPLPRVAATPRPVQLAQAQPPLPPAKPKGRDRRSRRERERDERAATAAAAIEAARRQPVEIAAATPPPLPQPQFTAPRPVLQPLAEQARPAQVASREPGRGGPAATVPAEVQPQPVATASAPAPPGPAKVGGEDKVLASIVANITIPGDELERMSVPPPEAARSERAPPRPEPARVAAKAPEPKAKPAPRKRPEPKKPNPAKAEPRRIWVQVAGGANEKMLPRAWKRVVEKAPAAFRGKSPWWTPLRATNRLLAGPFKTSGQAQDFVNALAQSDVSAFVFTSEAGQKISKLDLK